MKSLYILCGSVLLASLMLMLSGCRKGNSKKMISITYPIYATRAEVLASIETGPPKALKEPGKIFVYDDYLFINELNKGIHVIDNHNFAEPKQIAFINIPGNVDLAVKGNTLYADLSTDMVALDISDPSKIHMEKHLSMVFPDRQITYDTNLLIKEWITKDTMVEEYDGCITCRAIPMMEAAQILGAKVNVPGVAGSMTRFSVAGDELYTVSSSSLYVFDVTNPSDPTLVNHSYIGFNIETIYPFKNKLFIGASSGMQIFNIDDPAKPLPEGALEHVRACDPIVADDDFAYLTLRSGTECQGFTNQLEVIKVSNLSSPVRVREYPMTNPHGLAMDKNLLFVCDGDAGLKMYDRSKKDDLKLLQQISNIKSYDVIAWNGKLILIGNDGLYQYSYTSERLTFMSRIKVKGS